MPPSEIKTKTDSAGIIARNTLIVVGILAVGLFFWKIKGAFLLAFAGVILAIILSEFARILQKVVPISRPCSLATVGLLVILLIGLFNFVFGSQIIDEFEDLSRQLPEQIAQLRATISEWPLGEMLLDGEAGGNEENGNENNGANNKMTGEARGLLMKFGVTIVDGLSTLFMILITGIYFAVDPETYKKGIALLFPAKKAERINEVLETTGKALWQWLSGQFVAMMFVGITTTIGLMLIGVPMALILGVIAGLTDFVPIIGPWIGLIPALLLAFSIGVDKALYTLLLCIVVQQVESGLVTPLVQRRMVHIPPALIGLALVAFGSLFGIAGLVLATPLAVVAMVFVGMFYVQDVLGKDITIPGKNDTREVP